MSESTSSLKLICENYDSDAEEEDTNTSNHFDDICHPNEKLEPLPLPESIRNLFVTTDEEVIDDAELHSGRIRSFPHERGNWVTSVYISYNDTKQLNRICDTLINNFGEIGDFHSCDNFHISLSRTVILRHHWIDIFVDDLRKAFKNVKSFYVDVGELAVFVNDEKTRTFVGLKIEHGCSELLKCVQLVDKSLMEFKLPTFYEILQKEQT
ncbi:U6 snRNA phosphodiesterase 1 isoform X2 [Planococcus citri]|uniref:U6 snRNA phosphodiesterase 1 isoform X2 n=1 Tax=Planococcus citri TaxID=170843 RepID=UPI0031F79652